MDEHKACPFCYRLQKPKVEVAEVGTNSILVKEKCRICRRTISERISTAKIEKVRKDIFRLRKKIDQGDDGLADVLHDRVLTYRKLMQDG